MEKPKGFEEYLSDYRVVCFDSCCGEPIAWGWEITNRMTDELFRKLSGEYVLECLYPDWVVIDKTLTRQEAIEKYGEITDEEFGPRGGWKSVTFGDKKFISKKLKQ